MRTRVGARFLTAAAESPARRRQHGVAFPVRRQQVQLEAGKLDCYTSCPSLEPLMPAQPPASDPAALDDALQKSEARYRFLAETIPVQVWTARPDGMLDYVSSRAVNEFGIPMARLLLEGWQNVVHPDDLPGAVERWVRALSTGETYEVEFRLKMVDGSYAWYLARAVAPARSERRHRRVARYQHQHRRAARDAAADAGAPRRGGSAGPRDSGHARDAARRQGGARSPRPRARGSAHHLQAMRPAPDDWHAVAASKLDAVLGPAKGPGHALRLHLAAPRRAPRPRDRPCALDADLP